MTKHPTIPDLIVLIGLINAVTGLAQLIARLAQALGHSEAGPRCQRVPLSCRL